MDGLTLAPVIRGAYLAAGCVPVILFDENENPALPVLELPNEGEGKSLGSVAREILASLRTPEGCFPAGLRVPGLGAYYVGSCYEDAEAARRGEKKTCTPMPSAGGGGVLKGRISLVSGSARGFGAEIAESLAALGSFVFAVDVDLEGVTALAERLNASGLRLVIPLEADISDEKTVAGMALRVAAEAGGLDLLVSNAGVLRAGSVLELDSKDFDFVTRVNYRAFFLLVKHLSPLMIRQRSAAPRWSTDIVQINSKSGLVGSNKNGAYAGGKFGAVGLVQSFALELVEHGIKVNAVCPGNFFDGPLWSDPEHGLFRQYLEAGKVPGARTVADVRTFYENKVPMRRGCGGEDVFRAILYCVEQEYETGQALPVTGGQVMLH